MIETEETDETTTTDATRPLPDGWRWVRLGDVIAEAQSGFASGERDSEGAVQLRMNNVSTRGSFVWDTYIRVPASEQTVARYALRPNDILFNNTNSTELVGKSALFQEYGEPVVYSNHFTRLRTSPELLEPEYLSFWLQMQWKLKVFEGLCNRWIGQSAVKNDKLLALSIPLPPLPEQRRIAAILRERLAAVEQARASAAAQLAAARALPAAYLRAVFESDETQAWPRVRLGDVLSLRKDIVHPHDHPSGPATFVGLEHIESATGLRIGSDSLEMSELTGRKPRFNMGEIVYGYLRPYLNKVWVADFDGLCSVDQYVYSVNPMNANAQFIAWFMRSPVYLNRAPIHFTPGQLPRIRTEEVAAVEINLPPLPEQQRMVKLIENQMSEVGHVRDAQSAQLDAIDALPQALLRQAFAGEL